MEADHERIHPAAEALRAAGEQYAVTHDDAPRATLVKALDDLSAVLFPHLDREVEEAMPVVSSAITNSEWRAIERKHFIKQVSFAQLGFEAHWLLDGIDPVGYQVVTHAVPAVPRFILLHAFARSYRRRATATWRPDHVHGFAAAG
jgi:hypothetical protein